MNPTERETCKSDLLRCAASTDGWVDDLRVATRQWAADLPMEVMLLGLRSCREAVGPAGDGDSQWTTVRTVLLALACKDRDLVEDVAGDFVAFTPAGAPALRPFRAA